MEDIIKVLGIGVAANLATDVAEAAINIVVDKNRKMTPKTVMDETKEVIDKKVTRVKEIPLFGLWVLGNL